MNKWECTDKEPATVQWMENSGITSAVRVTRNYISSKITDLQGFCWTLVKMSRHHLGDEEGGGTQNQGWSTMEGEEVLVKLNYQGSLGCFG